ncbi:MAG: hypothetical protein K2N90_02910, partial [Lachnospiraceae bacterium]|nr:hypothetical protein [Lachnospiraceae bacterium]
MKSGKHQALKMGMIMIICLLSVAVTSCKKADTYTEISEVTEEETLHMEEEAGQDTDSMFTESEEDTIAKNLLCLKNA